MKILLLTDDMLTGGIAKHLSDIVQSNSRADIQYHLAATPGDYLTRIPKGVQFTSLSILHVNSFEKNIPGFVPSYRTLSQLIKQEKIELIHSHKRYSHLIGKLLSKQHRIPHITSYHTDVEGMKVLTYFGDYVTCCSEAVRDLLVSRYDCPEEKSRTIHYGIRPFSVHSEAKKEEIRGLLGISKKKRIISSVGQFIPVKDRTTLIRSIAILKKKINISELLFILLGYGEQLPLLKALVKELDIEDSVVFADGNSDVEALMNVSEFMILNSLREGFGIVLLEGASIGKVHIGTRVGGIPEFIEHGETGLLVKPGDPEALAESIHFLLQNPGKRMDMERKATLKFEQQFQIGTMLEKIYSVYDEALYGISPHRTSSLN